MTHDDLKAWRAQMGYSQRAAAQALDLTLKSYQQLERGADFETGKPRLCDLRTALACAALAAGIQPWGSPPSANPQ